MSYRSRLNKGFEEAIRLPLNGRTKYVLFSDCHRGIGNSNDNFLKNQMLYLAALQHYYRTGYTYIELGDGDELWENRNITPITETHYNIFQQLSLFHNQNRLYLLYGNHDIVKKDKRYNQPILSDICFHEGIILENTTFPDAQSIYLTHGHQADFLNSSLWRLSRFLVRHLWKPLERYGVLDPTSAAKNYKRKAKTEQRLHKFAEEKKYILIAGHTHRPVLLENDLYYCNSGSCIHPSSITCLELEQLRLCLVKWSLSVRADRSLYVSREILSGPVLIKNL